MNKGQIAPTLNHPEPCSQLATYGIPSRHGMYRTVATHQASRRRGLSAAEIVRGQGHCGLAITKAHALEDAKQAKRVFVLRDLMEKFHDS